MNPGIQISRENSAINNGPNKILKCHIWSVSLSFNKNVLVYRSHSIDLDNKKENDIYRVKKKIYFMLTNFALNFLPLL